MKEPIYKPDMWVSYQQDEVGGFGRIIGGSFDGENWHYTIAGSREDGSSHSAKETEIGYVMQNGSWLAPTTANASSSVYKDA
ncbi:MAG: hypothetical protein ACOH18_05100 [Candidatus Saccharimonadaceae bacterium]